MAWGKSGQSSLRGTVGWMHPGAEQGRSQPFPPPGMQNSRRCPPPGVISVLLAATLPRCWGWRKHSSWDFQLLASPEEACRVPSWEIRKPRWAASSAPQRRLPRSPRLSLPWRRGEGANLGKPPRSFGKAQSYPQTECYGTELPKKSNCFILPLAMQGCWHYPGRSR